MIVPLRVEILAGLAALVIGSGAIAWHEHNSRIRAEGIAEEKTRVADSALKVITPARIRAETVLVRDTRTVTRTVSRVDSLRDTLLLHLTDTIREKEFVLAVDTLRKSCTNLVTSCAAFRDTATAEIRELRAKLAASVVPATSCVMTSVLSGLVGLGVGYVAHRP